jgi:hypothetical protein
LPTGADILVVNVVNKFRLKILGDDLIKLFLKKTNSFFTYFGKLDHVVIINMFYIVMK